MEDKQKSLISSQNNDPAFLDDKNKKSHVHLSDELINNGELEGVVSSLLSQNAIKKDDLTNELKNSGKPELAHGKERLWIATAVLILCLVLPVIPWTPDNVKTGMLTIAGSITTSLFKGFEKY